MHGVIFHLRDKQLITALVGNEESRSVELKGYRGQLEGTDEDTEVGPIDLRCIFD